MDLAPTMSKIVSDSPKIVVVEVVGFDRATRVVSVKEVRALKGDLSPEVVQHQVAPAAGGAVPGRILQWAASPGACAQALCTPYGLDHRPARPTPGARLTIPYRFPIP